MELHWADQKWKHPDMSCMSSRPVVESHPMVTNFTIFQKNCNRLRPNSSTLQTMSTETAVTSAIVPGTATERQYITQVPQTTSTDPTSMRHTKNINILKPLLITSCLGTGFLAGWTDYSGWKNISISESTTTPQPIAYKSTSQSNLLSQYTYPSGTAVSIPITTVTPTTTSTTATSYATVIPANSYNVQRATVPITTTTKEFVQTQQQPMTRVNPAM